MLEHLSLCTLLVCRASPCWHTWNIEKHVYNIQNGCNVTRRSTLWPLPFPSTSLLFSYNVIAVCVLVCRLPLHPCQETEHKHPFWSLRCFPAIRLCNWRAL